MERLIGKPTFKREFLREAPTQLVAEELDEKGVVVSVNNVTSFHTVAKNKRLDRWLDAVVRASGSGYTFTVIMVTLLAWAFSGVVYGSNMIWQALISDVQAVLTYVFDSFLMRQQLNGYEEHQEAAVDIQSRTASNRRMLELLKAKIGKDEMLRLYKLADKEASDRFNQDLPSENLFEWIASNIARIVGHIISIIVYWIGIFIWIGFGQYCGWTPTWQLYINSATSALMVFIFAFLANIRERHGEYMRRCMDSIFGVDSALEMKLRQITGDRVNNPSILIPPPTTGWLQKIIFYYADIVGTLLGVAILIVVLVVWVCIGPALAFNATWQLLIGTYAGLIGLIDGFILRNVQAKLKGWEQVQYDKIAEDDFALFRELELPIPEPKKINVTTISYKISVVMGRICGHELMALGGVVTTIILIIISSVMLWNVTGQLISNVPPSIIESFFMMILITGHNVSDSLRRTDLHNIYERRLKLAAFIDMVEASQGEVSS